MRFTTVKISYNSRICTPRCSKMLKTWIWAEKDTMEVLLGIEEEIMAATTLEVHCNTA